MPKLKKVDIIKELGLEGLPEKTQAKLMSQMTESVLKRITLRVLERLSEEDRRAFDALREAKEPEKVDQFLRSKIPNYEVLLNSAVTEFKAEMQDTVAMLKEKLG